MQAPEHGYIGVARVTGSAQPALNFKVKTSDGKMRPVMKVVASPQGYHKQYIHNMKKCEYFVPVRWLQTVPVEKAVKQPGFFATELIVCEPKSPKWRKTLKKLKKEFPNYSK